MNPFIKLVNIIDFALLRKQRRTRTDMRRETVFTGKKKLTVYEYINHVSAILPNAYYKGDAIDHKLNLRRYYMNFGVPGIKFYIRALKRNN